jgi:hypothetical protein
MPVLIPIKERYSSLPAASRENDKLTTTAHSLINHLLFTWLPLLERQKFVVATLHCGGRDLGKQTKNLAANSSISFCSKP